MSKHPLLTFIDTWEQEFIIKIQATGELARGDLQQLLDRTESEMKTSFDTIANEIQTSQELNDYTEIDLMRWLKITTRTSNET